MSEEQYFLEAISTGEPNADLIYADWLEEQGKPEADEIRDPTTVLMLNWFRSKFSCFRESRSASKSVSKSDSRSMSSRRCGHFSGSCSGSVSGSRYVSRVYWSISHSKSWHFSRSECFSLRCYVSSSYPFIQIRFPD